VRLLPIRAGERRDTLAAFLTLFGLVGSHAVLETARDALFLAKIAAARLPYVFVAIAALSFVVARLPSLVGRRAKGRATLTAWTLAAAAITLGFYGLLARLGASGLYALYVWSGLVTTLVVARFWALAGGLFSLTQAKRLYPIIGAGSVVGAIAGSGVAGVLARIVAPRQLLLVAACGLAITSLVPALLGGAAGEPATAADGSPRVKDDLGYLARTPYARRVVGSMLVATVCLTIGDFLFKSMVARLVPPAQLASFLGSVYFACNGLSLVCQLFVVGGILRRFSLGASLAILPALLAIGGAGVASTGALAAIVALRGADGGLRYSLHRTASELLLLPFGVEARRRIRALVDVAAIRGGQVVAAVVLLVLGALGASSRVVAVALVVTALAWAATAIALRGPYIELFRARLKTGRLAHLDDFPELDVASLETLVLALDSDRDAEVIAALGVLEREGKAHLIPALILYHPSDDVVEHALAIFTRAGRKNVVHVIDRIDGASPRVRAASIAARSVLAPDPDGLRECLAREESEIVRATIVVNLIASGAFEAAEAKRHVDAFVERGDAGALVALAEAIGRRGASGFDDVLRVLWAAKEPEVRVAAVIAMGRVLSPALLPCVIEGLAEEPTRGEAERVLVAYDAAGLAALDAALAGGDLPPALRWRIPHAISVFGSAAAASILLARLPREADGGVRYQIIRALEALTRRSPELPLDRAVLDAMIERTLQRAFRFLDCRLILARGAEADPARSTPGHALLASILRDKEQNAIGRVFRLLGLAHPGDDFAQIHQGLAAGGDARATSLELIESLLADPLRAAVRGIVDDGPDVDRRRAGAAYHAPLGLDYEGLLAHLLTADSEAVQDIAVFHVGELGLTSFRGKIAPLPNPAGARTDLTRALSLLGGGEMA
jgi:ATP/ADP translocase